MDEKTNQDNESEKKVSNPYDALFKQVMTDLFNALHIMVKTEQEVSRKPRTIDVAVTCTQEQIEKARRESPFDFLKKHNIIALKSIADPLTIWEYHKIRARTHFHIAENKLSPKDTIICAVCSAEPRKVLHDSQDAVEFTMISPWHYVSNEKIPFHVIIVRKLPLEFKYYPLLLFAPVKKFKEFVKHAIGNNRLEYLDYAYMLHPKETREVLMMTGKFPIPEENVKFIVNDLTPERVLRHINLEALPEENIKFIVNDLGIERILRNADIDEVVRCIDIEDILRGINPDEALQKLPDALLKSFSREDLEKFQALLNDKIAEDKR